jgi:hypothetical protein
MPIAAIIVALFEATGRPSTRRFQTLFDGNIEQAASGGIGPAVASGVVGATVGACVAGTGGARVGGAVGALDGFEVGAVVGGDVHVPAVASWVGTGVDPEPDWFEFAPALPAVEPAVGSPGVVLPTAMMPRGAELDAPGSPGPAAAVPSATGLGDASATTIARTATSGRPNQASRFPRMRIYASLGRRTSPGERPDRHGPIRTGLAPTWD